MSERIALLLTYIYGAASLLLTTILFPIQLVRTLIAGSWRRADSWLITSMEWAVSMNRKSDE